jgi:hypothetical protein
MDQVTQGIPGEGESIPRGILADQVPLTPRSPGLGEITAAEIQAAYEAAFGIAGNDWLHKLLRLFLTIRTPFYFADQYYQPVDEELLQMILDADTGDKEEYETEFYDCDDFAFRLMGWFHMDRDAATWPLFITWVNTPQGGHAVLSYYKDGEVFIIEPQTDQVFPVPADWSLILLCG